MFVRDNLAFHCLYWYPLRKGDGPIGSGSSIVLKDGWMIVKANRKFSGISREVIVDMYLRHCLLRKLRARSLEDEGIALDYAIDVLLSFWSMHRGLSLVGALERLTHAYFLIPHD